jgi:mannitol operon repressor
MPSRMMKFLGRWVSCTASALPPAPLFDDSDADLLAMQKQRYQQVVRSTMVLSLTELI